MLTTDYVPGFPSGSASYKKHIEKIRTKSAGVKGAINKLKKKYDKEKYDDEKEKLKKQINENIAVFNEYQKQIKELMKKN